MPGTSFDTTLARVEQNLRDLEEQLANNLLPHTQNINDIRNLVRLLRGSCPAEKQAQLRAIERRFNDLQITGKEQYVQAIDTAMNNSARILAEEQQISHWIDTLTEVFGDMALAGEKRTQINQLVQREKANKILHDTEQELQYFWNVENTTVLAGEITHAHQQAVTRSREAVQQAQQLATTADVLQRLRELQAEARRREEDVRERFEIMVTRDQLGKFSVIINELESRMHANPDEFVNYIPAGSLEPEMMPVKEALAHAHERWGEFVREKAAEYLNLAREKLAENAPEEAQQALGQLWKLDVPSPELLLDVDKSPVEISADLRIELRETLNAIKQAEDELYQFRAHLNKALNSATPEEAWTNLLHAERAFPQFVSRDKVWADVQLRVVRRYHDWLQSQVDSARAALIRGDDQSYQKIIRVVMQAIEGQDRLNDIHATARQLEESFQDKICTVHSVSQDLQSRRLDDAREAQRKLQGLRQRLEPFGLQNLEHISIIQARVEAVIESAVLLSRLESRVQSDNLETLQQALTEANSAVRTITEDRVEELRNIIAHLEAKKSLVMGNIQLQHGDLSLATQYVQEALQHPETRVRARDILSEIKRIEESDEEIRNALTAIDQLSACEALERLRPLQSKPSQLRQKLNEALQNVEDQCRQILEEQLGLLRQQADFDVVRMCTLLAQLALIDAQRSSTLKQELSPLMANREAMIAWEQEHFAQAREYWSQAHQLDEQYEKRYKAALKQEMLNIAKLFTTAPEETISDLQQYLARDLPGDPHLWMELSRARLFYAMRMPWDKAEEFFSAAEQAADQALRRSRDWMQILPAYEQERQQLVQQINLADDTLYTLVDRAQTFTHEIQQHKIVAREKGWIERNLTPRPKYSLLAALSAVQKKTDLENRPQLLHNPTGREQFAGWWNDRVNATVLDLEGYLFELSEQGGISKGSDQLLVPMEDSLAEATWEELEARLIILVLDPDNPQGQKAVNELLHQITLLYQRFDLEQENTNGAGFTGNDSEILEQQIVHLQQLNTQMRVLRSVLDYLAAHEHTHSQIRPPVLTWYEQRENFYKQTKTFQGFYNDLLRFKQAKEVAIAQIQTALSSGNWTPVDNTLELTDITTTTRTAIPSRFQVHRTFQWLRTERQRSSALRERQVRRRNEVLWCLELQMQVDAQPWHMPDERTEVTTAPQSPIEQLKGEPWVHAMHAEHRRKATTPIEMYSLVELVHDRLNDMQREDPEDRCSLDQELCWTDPGREEHIGIDEIRDALQPLLLQLDAVRRWLHPVVGGRLSPTFKRQSMSASTNQSIPPSSDIELVANKVNWQQVRQLVDKLRRRSYFDDAIKLCEWACDHTRHTVEDIARIDPLLGREKVSSLSQTQDYLRRQSPLRTQRLLTGMTIMLDTYVQQLQEEIQQNIAEATNAVADLRAMEHKYSSCRNRLNSNLERYRDLLERTYLPVVGRMWQHAASETLTETTESYKECYRICPEASVLAGEQILQELQITKTYQDGIEILPLFDAVEV
jgi:hypothetical protein